MWNRIHLATLAYNFFENSTRSIMILYLSIGLVLNYSLISISPRNRPITLISTWSKAYFALETIVFMRGSNSMYINKCIFSNWIEFFVIYCRCSECGTIKEEYSDEELGLCIINLGTFIHREPSLAAPLLPEILRVVTKSVSSFISPVFNSFFATIYHKNIRSQSGS